MAVETGAGSTASGSDEEYEAAGASVADRESVLKDADIILGVQGPDPASLAGLKPGAWLVAGLNPFGERARVDAYAGPGIEPLAMEFMPRITRAQSMDILSSESNLPGHKARSEEHTSELQSLMLISYAVLCLKKKIQASTTKYTNTNTTELQK